MISKMLLTNYKGFERFSLKLGGRKSILVGPNNAGKSTAIGALRLGAQLLSYAKLRKPEFIVTDTIRGRSVHAYRLTSAASGFIDENVAYEFRDVEARVEIHFANRAALYVAWPPEDSPYFYLEHIPGAQPPSIRIVRRDYPSVGVVQTLTPVEHRESILSFDYVRKNLGTRLASRHFRNQLYVLNQSDSGRYEDFRDYVLLNTPEIASLELVRSSINAELDLFYTESNSRVEKEIYWAGDGLQIWLQLLYHIWRHADVGSIIIDEPDVYLHPDLQRRLVKILELSESQVILATHAPEVLAESNRESVIVLDRARRSSKRISNDAELSTLNNALGSGFNLRLAKALRSRAALFVEGQDMKILSNLAKTAGAAKFYREDGLTVVPMGGASKRKLATSFGLLNRSILGSSVRVAVLLDRDYLDDASVEEIVKEFESQEVFAHVWQMNEIENYLVCPPAISRLSGLPEEDIGVMLTSALDELKEDSFAQILARELDVWRRQGEHAATTVARVKGQFDHKWESDLDWRLQTLSGKDILSHLNGKIQSQGGKAVSARALSFSLRRDEMPEEMRGTLLDIEAML